MPQHTKGSDLIINIDIVHFFSNEWMRIRYFNREYEEFELTLIPLSRVDGIEYLRSNNLLAIHLVQGHTFSFELTEDLHANIPFLQLD